MISTFFMYETLNIANLRAVLKIGGNLSSLSLQTKINANRVFYEDFVTKIFSNVH